MNISAFLTASFILLGVAFLILMAFGTNLLALDFTTGAIILVAIIAGGATWGFMKRDN